jgi:hypothetical protein
MLVALPILPHYIFDKNWIHAVEFLHGGNHQLAYLILLHLEDETGFFEHASEHSEDVFNTTHSHHDDGLQRYYDDKFEEIFLSEDYQLGLLRFYYEHRQYYKDLLGDATTLKTNKSHSMILPTTLKAHHRSAILVRY